jgi:hypothetical protein
MQPRISISGLILYFIISGAAAGNPEIEMIFPGAAVLDGLTLNGEIKQFNPDNLWEHIDGADQQYLNFGCQSLTAVSYHDSTRAVDLSIELYAMQDELSAFGVYASQKPASAKSVDIGADAYCSGSELNFYKGLFYARLSVSPAQESNLSILLKTANDMTTRIDSSGSVPELFAVFPKENVVPGSFGYLPDGILGIKGLSRGLTLKYMIQETEVAIYLIRTETADRVTALSDTFTTAYARQGESPLIPVEIGKFKGSEGVLKYRGPVLVLYDTRAMLIVSGHKTKSEVSQLAEQVLASFSGFSGSKPKL